MRVFILSLLAVSSVNSHAIQYPYHNQLLAYSPARGEFPVYNDIAQGHLRYYDSNGVQHQLGYNYPEPLYGIRRYSYVAGNNGNQLLRTTGSIEPGFNAASYYQIQDSAEIIKAREEHFRRWCEQRYQALKAEMEKLRAEGLKPSSDMMAQLQPLEKIISSTTYTGLVETPEVQRIRDEHLRIWNEARLKVLRQEADHLRFHQHQQGSNELLSSISGVTSNVNAIIGETDEQKKAREEHLRIYNEQLQLIKKLEAERLQQTGSKNEAEISGITDQSNQFQQGVSFQLKSSLEQGQQQVQEQQQQGQVMDTPEVIRAREEHLRLVNEAKLRAQAEGTYNANDDGSYKPEKIDASPVLKIVPGLQQPIQPIQNIAILQTTQPTQQALVQQQESTLLKTSSIDSTQQQQLQAQPAPVQDTPEVIRAREEHLKLFNEAKLKASQQTETSSNIQQAEKIETYAAKIDSSENIREIERMREEQRLMEAERMREAERLREEEKMRELERLREIERQKEEERMLEAERLRLKQEEEQRLEKERLEEMNRLKEAEQKRIQQGSIISSSISSDISGSNIKSTDQSISQLKTTATTAQSIDSSSSGSSSSLSSGSAAGSSGASITGTGYILSSQYQSNPYLVRFASQPGTTTYIVGEQQAAIPANPSLFYLPTKTDSNSIIQQQNPFLLRFTQSGIQAGQGSQQQQIIGPQQSTLKPIVSSEKVLTYSSSSGSQSSDSSSSSSSSSSSIKLNYGSSSNDPALLELEKATRDHFRAHEIALEQLRLANLKNPHVKDC